MADGTNGPLAMSNMGLQGEGEPDALVELSYQFFAANPDGSVGRNLDPNPNDSQLEARIPVGQRFVVRTLARDLRTAPVGIFSVYSDFNYTNADGSNSEKMEIQWGDYDEIRIGPTAISGTFQLKYGLETTIPIEFGTSLEKTAARIQSSIESLSGIGTGNVSVRGIGSNMGSDIRFGVNFKGNVARRDIPNPTLLNNAIRDSATPPGSVSATVVSTSNVSPVDPNVLRSSINYQPVPLQNSLYNNGQTGQFVDFNASTPGKRTLQTLGGFSNSSTFLPPGIASSFLPIYDVQYIARGAGTVNLSQTHSPLSGNLNTDLGISLFGDRPYLLPNQITFPSASVTIFSGFAAIDDLFLVQEDSAKSTFNLISNDIDPYGSSREIVSITQPTNGGTVSLDSNKSTVGFQPTADFFGRTTFTYTVRNNIGDLSVGTVTINVAPVNDAPTLASIADLTVNLNQTSQTINLTGITAGGGESQKLKVTSSSSNVGLIPNPSVVYITPNSTGSVSFAPVKNTFGSTTVSVTVEDGGLDNELSTLSDNLSFTRSFIVSVKPPKGGFQNPSNRYDVDADGFVSPLDFLNVINLLNSKGANTSVVGLPTPPPYFDVDGDDVITPLDSLAVNDFVNSRSGSDDGSVDPNYFSTPLQAQFSYAFFAVNPDGSIGRNLDPNPNDNTLEALIGVGEKFVVRTLVRDTRSNPKGVYSTYSDFNYTNADGSSTERMAVQWGEPQSILIGSNARAGTFQLQFGSSVTAPIPIGLSNGFFDANKTAVNIQSALEALQNIGLKNVVVLPSNIPSSGFKVVFQNALARADVANLVIVNNQVTTGGSNPESVALSSSSLSSVSPSNPAVLGAAIRLPPSQQPSVPTHSNAMYGYLDDSNMQSSGQRVLRSVGGFTNASSLDTNATGFTATQDMLFSATQAGVINVSQSIAPLDQVNLGITGFGNTGGYAKANQVQMPTAKITIVDRLVANGDSFTVIEDSGKTSLNVVLNDVDRFGSTRGVVGLTQPATGGSVTFAPNGSSVDFVPATDFFGKVQFSYTLQNNLGDQAVGTVTIEVQPVNDAPVASDRFADGVENETLSIPFTEITTGLSPGPFEDTQKLTITQISLNNANDGSISIVGNNIVFQPAVRLFGSVIAGYRVTDDGVPPRSSVGVLTINLKMASPDFGDAPTASQSGFASSYPSKLADDGARHRLGSLYLGSAIDRESDSAPNGVATGDNLSGLADEDGISFPITNATSPTQSTKSSFVAVSSQPGFLDAWIDFNQDGDWDDASEDVSVKFAVAAGSNIIPFDIPAATKTGTTFARFRLSSTGGLSTKGLAQDGEVEDYAIVFESSSQLMARMQIAPLGTPGVSVSDGTILVTSGSKVVWSAPAADVSTLSLLDASSVKVRELKDFVAAPPDIVRYSETGKPVEVQVVSPTLSLAASGATSLQGVKFIDLRQSGASTVAFSIDDIKQINMDKSIQIRLDANDAISTPSSWKMGSGRVENGVWVQTYTSPTGETKLEVIGDRPWRNEVLRLDTDGDSTISPLDALILINGLNNNIFGNGRLPGRTTSSPTGFYDPDGDNSLSPLDVLSVINKLNSKGEAEGEGGSTIVSPIATDLLFSQWSYVSDLDTVWNSSPNRRKFRDAMPS